MGFEIPFDTAYPSHPKTLKLIALLKKPEADVYPIRLWAWAAEYARDGVVVGGAAQVELAVRWRGLPGRLHGALVEAGFLEKDGLTIHGWKERTGRAILIYEQKKRKQRERYAQSVGILPAECTTNSPYPGNSGYPGQDRQDTPPASAGVLDGLAHALTQTAIVPTPKKPPASSNLGRLLKLAQRAKLAAKLDSLRVHLEAWVARSDYTRVEQILMDPWTRGKTIIEIQEHFFPRPPKLPSNGQAAFVPSVSACRMCGGSQTIAGDVVDGKIVLTPCRHCVKA